MTEPPVWEYRVWPAFAENLTARLKSSFSFDAELPRTDTYFVVEGETGKQAKLRGNDSLDIKVCLNCQTGLERWQTVLNSVPPVAEADMGRLRQLYPQLADELATLSGVRQAFGRFSVTAEVSKSRYLAADADGVRAEIARIALQGQTYSTFCLEHASADALAKSVEALGFNKWPNTSYPAWLQAMVFPAC